MHVLGHVVMAGRKVHLPSTLRQGRSASWAQTLPRAESGSSPSRWTSPSPSTTASIPTGEAKGRSASASSRRPLPPTLDRCRREEETSSPPGWDSWSCAKSRSPPSSSPSLAPRESRLETRCKASQPPPPLPPLARRVLPWQSRRATASSIRESTTLFLFTVHK